jgi:hypothetical protein
MASILFYRLQLNSVKKKRKLVEISIKAICACVCRQYDENKTEDGKLFHNAIKAGHS